MLLIISTVGICSNITLFIFQVGVGGALEAEGVTAGEGEHLTVGVTFMTDSLVVYALTIHRWKL